MLQRVWHLGMRSAAFVVCAVLPIFIPRQFVQVIAVISPCALRLGIMWEGVPRHLHLTCAMPKTIMVSTMSTVQAHRSTKTVGRGKLAPPSILPISLNSEYHSTNSYLYLLMGIFILRAWGFITTGLSNCNLGIRGLLRGFIHRQFLSQRVQIQKMLSYLGLG